MEQKVEKVASPAQDKERYFENVGMLLTRGYAISGSELSETAEANGLNRSSAAGMLETRKATEVMKNFGVMPVTLSHLGRKLWIDGNGGTNPEEIAHTKTIMDRKRKRIK